MPVVQWVVNIGYTVETRDGEVGVVREMKSKTLPSCSLCKLARRWDSHEMLLVFFTFLALAAGWRYRQPVLA